MNQLNEKLEPLSMSVEKIPCEVTGQYYWILVNTLSDDTARYKKKNKKKKTKFFHNIINKNLQNLCKIIDKDFRRNFHRLNWNY